jgi:hypothetical protein
MTGIMTAARTSTENIAPPTPIAAYAEQTHKRLVSAREQLEAILSAIDPSPRAASNEPRPQRAGLFGTMNDVADVVSDIDALVAQIGQRISG